MQDFTKALNRNIEIKQAVDNNTAELKIDLSEMPNLPNQPKTSFIEARLNKDNFWNLMFLTLPSIPIFVTQEIIDLIPGGIFLLIATLILSPYLVSRANKVEYKDNMFHSAATKRALGQYAPEATGFVLWSAIPFTAFWVLFLHNKQPNLDETLAVYNIIFWFVPTAYFILKNLPISIIFNKKAWAKGDNNHSEESYSRSHKNWLWYNVWYKR